MCLWIPNSINTSSPIELQDVQCGRDQIEEADGDEGEAGPLRQHRLGCPRRPPLPAHIQVYQLRLAQLYTQCCIYLSSVYQCLFSCA